jgi:hypothetical protein
MLYTIQLFADEQQEVYCGCWHVACPASSRMTDVLEAAGFGTWFGADGLRRRSIFLHAEVLGELGRARKLTGCTAVPVAARSVVRALA